MALKPLLTIGYSDVSYFMNEVSNRGSVVSVSTVGSGDAMDQSAALCTVAAVGSGSKPLGILLCDMVDKDLSQTHLNAHKYEQQKGSKVEILMQGICETDQIASGITINGGDDAYVGNGGRITNVFVGGTHVKIGRFISKADEDGYAKIQVNLP